MGKIDLSIIIVNWNSGPLLTDCIHAIKEKTTAISYEVLVVDNASSDNSVAQMTREHPDVALIQNSENYGFARGNNVALPHCQGRYIGFLNPDTVLLNRVFEDMVVYLDSHSQVGAVGPRLINADGSIQVGAAGEYPTLRTVLNEASALSQLFPHYPVFQGLYLRGNPLHNLEVGWLSGACLVVRQEIPRTVGGLNEGFFLYFEDQEWCYRIKQRGYKIMHLPHAMVLHYGSQSLIKMKVGDIKKNHITVTEYFRTFNSRTEAVVASWIFLLGLGIRYLASFIRDFFKKNAFERQRLVALHQFFRIIR